MEEGALIVPYSSLGGIPEGLPEVADGFLFRFGVSNGKKTSIYMFFTTGLHLYVGKQWNFSTQVLPTWVRVTTTIV